MKKSSLVSIIAHSLVLIVISFNQNLINSPKPKLAPQSKVEVVYFGIKPASTESYDIADEETIKSNSSEVTSNSAHRKPKMNEKFVQIQNKNLPASNSRTNKPLGALPNTSSVQIPAKLATVKSKVKLSRKEEQSSIDHATMIERVEHVQKLHPEKRYNHNAIKNNNQMQSRVDQRGNETPKIVKTDVAQPEKIANATLPMPFPKPARIKDKISEMTDPTVILNGEDRKGATTGNFGYGFGFESKDKQAPYHTSSSPEIAGEQQNKIDMNQKSSDQELSPAEGRHDFNIKAKEQKYLDVQPVKTFVRSGSPNIFYNRNLSQTTKPMRSSKAKVTPDRSNRASCKRTLSVIVPSRQQIENFHSKKLLTVNDLLGQPLNLNTSKHQVTISDLLGTNILNHRRQQSNISVSELLQNNTSSSHAKTVVCIE